MTLPGVPGPRGADLRDLIGVFAKPMQFAGDYWLAVPCAWAQETGQAELSGYVEQ